MLSEARKQGQHLFFFGSTLINFSLIYDSLYLDFLITKATMIQLIDAIARNEAKLRSPMMINVFHLVASGNCPNIEIGTVIPTKIDKASVALNDPKRLFLLFTVCLPLYSVSTWPT